MSEDHSPPPSLLPVLVVILVADVVVLAVLASRGMLQSLPPAAQFFYGVTTFAFPVLVYFLLKRRRDRNG